MAVNNVASPTVASFTQIQQSADQKKAEVPKPPAEQPNVNADRPLAVSGAIGTKINTSA